VVGGGSGRAKAASLIARARLNRQAYLPNIADSEVLNEVSQIVLKIDRAGRVMQVCLSGQGRESNRARTPESAGLLTKFLGFGGAEWGDLHLVYT
jgi:hypothetical protein